MIFMDNQRGCELFSNVSLRVLTARCVTIENDWWAEKVNSPFSRLYYVKSGSGNMFFGDTQIVMQPGCVYLVPAELEFSHAPLGSMEKLYFHFNIITPDGNDLLRNLGKIKFLELGMSYIEEMYRLFLSQSFTDAFYLKGRILGDIQKLLWNEDLPQERFSNYSKDVLGAMKLVLAAPTVKTSVRDLAKMLYISESALSKDFKREVGMTVGEYIDKTVMREARKLLSETDWAIPVISEQLGFCDRSYFSRRFRQLCGIPPHEYRKRTRVYKG